MTQRSTVALRLAGFVIVLLGLALSHGGALLVLASGSAIYLSGGMALVVAGLMLMMAWRLGLHLYALFLFVTLIWSVYEVGFSLWPLLPRLDLWFALGLLLLLPWFGSAVKGMHGAPRLPLFVVSLVTGLTLLGSSVVWLTDPGLVGQLPSQPLLTADTAGSAASPPAADWPSYGRTQAGTSHSPLGQITPSNAHTLQRVWTYHTGRNGTIRDTAPLPIPLPLGVPSPGGIVTTASGVACMAGTLDNTIRAYDETNGRPLWSHRLPAGAQAKPAVYAVDGREYVVITSGGHQGLGTTTGDAITACALPRHH